MKLSNQIYFIYFIPMDKTCNPEKLYERKHPRESMPLKECAECLFNVLCNDYTIYESEKENIESKKDYMKN